MIHWLNHYKQCIHLSPCTADVTSGKNERVKKIKKVSCEKIQNFLTEMNPKTPPPRPTTTCYSRSFSERHVWSVRGYMTWGNVIGGRLSYITHKLLLLPFASGVSLRASAPHRADGNTNTSKSLFIPQINLYTWHIRKSALLLFDLWYTYIVLNVLLWKCALARLHDNFSPLFHPLL